MARQMTCQRYIYKVHSSRLRKGKWELILPLSEARKNDELISLADSQILRWLDELNGVVEADAQARSIRQEIRKQRKEPSSIQGRRRLKQLYEQLDEIQFKPDYLCVVMDKEKDFQRACKGFSVNGMRYVRLVGTNGGVKEKTIVFVGERHAEELRRRIDNDRVRTKELVPAKLEAYRALTCSASTPVSMPRGILVVEDCQVQFMADTIYLDDETEREPVMVAREGGMVDLDESDGYGIMLPSLAVRWALELDLDYLPSGMNTRFAWEKGMVFCFDFLEFSRLVAGTSKVRDAWGVERDVGEVELILTTSMVKLWDSYDSCEDYLACCRRNGYQFGVTKVCPEFLERERCLNYQFIQSYELEEEDIDSLLAPTLQEFRDVLGADYQKTLLFLKGVALNEKNIQHLEDDYCKALMIEPALLEDPYVQSKLYQLIKTRIDEAKVGVLKVHGNYSIVSGDPYALCQSIFGLEVTGILRAGEIYNKYWVETEVERLVCFRAPMTCHNNIRAMAVKRSSEASFWYQYMNTCTVFNCWDTAAHALNGMDKDGDLVMLTDNEVLLRNLKELPALMCVQRKAKKKLSAEEDFIQANVDSFGDDIGKTTNRITAMFEVQSKFSKDSPEFKVLDYRIKCGQLFQQNAIDKAKGIIAKPMPREWYDRHHIQKIEDERERAFQFSILADKKPYFMRYIYPNLKKDYDAYIKNTNKKSMREFSLPLDALLTKDKADLTQKESEFLQYYHAFMPVGIGDCVVNRICRKVEAEFTGYLRKKKNTPLFDCKILKSGVRYSAAQSKAVAQLLEEYNKRMRAYVVLSKKERISAEEAAAHMQLLGKEFRSLCDVACSNSLVLCDILLDLCYQKEATKGFVLSEGGDQRICVEYLWRRDYRQPFAT